MIGLGGILHQFDVTDTKPSIPTGIELYSIMVETPTGISLEQID